MLLGSFLVPVTVIFWFLDRDARHRAQPRRLLLAFFVAGVLGLLAAAALEVWLLPSRLFPNVWVGLIEEASKAVGVIVLARGLRRYTVRDGILLGVVVGLGFGAFECSGYTLNYGFDDGRVLDLEPGLRGDPARGHRAVLPRALDRAVRRRALRAFARGRAADVRRARRLPRRAALHALWDAASTAGIVVTVLASGDETQREAVASGRCRRPRCSRRSGCSALVEWAVMIARRDRRLLLVRRRWVTHDG